MAVKIGAPRPFIFCCHFSLLGHLFLWGLLDYFFGFFNNLFHLILLLNEELEVLFVFDSSLNPLQLLSELILPRHGAENSLLNFKLVLLASSVENLKAVKILDEAEPVLLLFEPKVGDRILCFKVVDVEALGLKK